MRIHKVATVYNKEILETLRDKKTLFMMIVIPLILYPLVFIGTGYFSGLQREKSMHFISKVVVTNAGENNQLVEAIVKYGKFTIVNTTNEVSALKLGDIQLVIQAPFDFQDNLENDIPSNLTILYDESNVKSQDAKEIFIKFFDYYKNDLIRSKLERSGISGALLDVVSIETQNIASAEKMGAFIVGMVMPILVLILSFTGAMHTASSITAGEKVKQTIETLLVSAISRKEIVLGKFITVMTTSIVTAFLGLLSLFITFEVGFTLLSASTETQIAISPYSTIIMFIMILPVAGIFSALLIALGTYARTTKEAEMYYSSCIIIILALGMASLTPGFEPGLKLFMIPVMNTTLIQKELLMSNFDLVHISLTLGSTVALAFAALYAANNLFSREEILFRT